MKPHPDINPLKFASEANDLEWSEVTGLCGRCGTECHPAPCSGPYCRICPDDPYRPGARYSSRTATGRS